jgi:hypothetical protein
MKLLAGAVLIVFILPTLAGDTSNMPYADQIQREVPGVNLTDIYYPDGSLKEPYSTIAYLAMLEGINAEVADILINHVAPRNIGEQSDDSRWARQTKDRSITRLDEHNYLVSVWFKNDLSRSIALQRDARINI